MRQPGINTKGDWCEAFYVYPQLYRLIDLIDLRKKSLPIEKWTRGCFYSFEVKFPYIMLEFLQRKLLVEVQNLCVSQVIDEFEMSSSSSKVHECSNFLHA